MNKNPTIKDNLGVMKSSQKHFQFILYPYGFPFVALRSAEGAVICPAWRYWAIAVIETRPSSSAGGGSEWRGWRGVHRRRCAATDSAELAGQEGAAIGTTCFAPESSRSPSAPSAAIWQSISRLPPSAKHESKSLEKEGSRRHCRAHRRSQASRNEEDWL